MPIGRNYLQCSTGSGGEEELNETWRPPLGSEVPQGPTFPLWTHTSNLHLESCDAKKSLRRGAKGPRYRPTRFRPKADIAFDCWVGLYPVTSAHVEAPNGAMINRWWCRLTLRNSLHHSSSTRSNPTWLRRTQTLLPTEILQFWTERTMCESPFQVSTQIWPIFSDFLGLFWQLGCFGRC